MVLQTTLPGPESLVQVTDLLPWDGSPPPGRLVRLVVALRGPAHVTVDVTAGGDPRDIHVWSEGMSFAGAVVRCNVPFGRDGRAETTLDTGDAIAITVDPPGATGDPLSVDAARQTVDRTVTAWRRVLRTIDVPGPYAEAVLRSALVLKALGPGPVSSPITSLPREIGGERNADGRVVAPVTVAGWASAARAVGLAEEASDALDWLAGAVELEPPLPSRLAPDGGAPPTERHLSALAGWRGSQPVLAGTNAPDRLSCEPSAAAVAALATLRPGERWDCVAAHADWLADHWSDPDATVWDLHGPRRRWSSPRLAARRGLLTAAAAARARNPLDLDAAGWHASARDVEAALLGAADGGLLRPGPSTDYMDAALARVAAWGPWPAEDAVVAATLDRLIERNGNGPWLHPWPLDVDDGLPGTEPPSVAASLWLASALAAAGRWDAARERVEAAIDLGGSLHLLSEAVHPVSGMPVGNRSAAEAHLALIEAALTMADAPG